MRTRGTLLATTLAIAVLGTTAGCSFGWGPSVFEDEQVAADALPDGQEAVDTLAPESSHLLGDAEGSRWWAARNEAGEFCLVKAVVRTGGALDDVFSGCGGDEGGGMSVEDGEGLRGTWSAVADPEVPADSTLLREHLIVTPAP
ncbi:hypothetical protein IFT77_06020 [Frigoribacterium sp. CFBP 13729]|uniref:hypothetical protein n=1 Tax=Frigoribacterium sp. CFBP 13729 TaxID=2775293 RepID=UPI001782DC19|nr:hypothetical protein [Frigoribacterium sp. CFBP 13729]MBD8610036.1 hypothetical protein [Frigoribacterium sp. CFBP 13729]